MRIAAEDELEATFMSLMYRKACRSTAERLWAETLVRAESLRLRTALGSNDVRQKLRLSYGHQLGYRI